MSFATKISDKISEQVYLEGELVSEVRHEYIDGYVYAMAGASKNHGLISVNISRELGNHLKQKKSPCKVFLSDMKVRLSDISTNFFYPDVVVTCDTDDNDSEYYINSPIIIVEVLSKATRQYDLTIKKADYFNIPSLQEYVVIEQDFCEIEVFSKIDGWASNFYFLGDHITFKSMDVVVSVEDIYYQVENANMMNYLKMKEDQKEK